MALWDFLSGGEGKIAGMDPEFFSILAGEAGAAISPKESWQQRLGTTAAKMGRSKKFAKAAESEQARWRELIESLGLTPKGTPGISGIKYAPSGELSIDVTPGSELEGETRSPFSFEFGEKRGPGNF